MRSPERRLTVVSGAAATLLAVIGALLLARLPGVDQSPEEVHAFVLEHRTLLLVAACCWGLAATATAGFAVGLWRLGRGSSLASATVADVGLAGGVLLVAMEYVGWGFLLPLAFRPTDVNVTRLLADMVFLLLAFAGFPAALWTTAAAWSLRGSGIIKPWVEWLGYASAVAHIEAAFALAESGPFSPSGFGAYVAPVLISVWIAMVVLAVILRGREPSGRFAKLL